MCQKYIFGALTTGQTVDTSIFIEGGKLLDFLNWFEDGKGREVSADREFNEEILSSGLVDKDGFPYLRYRFIKRIKEEIKFDEHFQCQQILIADIYELILDDFQLSELRKLGNSDSGMFTLSSESEISRLGASLDGQRRLPISRTAKWII
ncbi:hypothetical protein [Sporosarcina ureae]|uniref:SMODS-associated NUDIX domain-containing protein n=1 Tax=Sporosarcina ureae TaxID=1571 RepID=UPI0009DC7851|nr:hypothetical protein [Sporosarcina ureae]ARF16724.1 hypothetical protein SporoP17a_05105 [Sporosarcina ureae]